MTTTFTDVDDSLLMAAVRRGQSELFGVLYQRHEPMATAYARRLARGRDEANDLVSEAFARMLSILQRGLGPADEFRPYLMRTVRNIAYDRYRGAKLLEFTDQMELLDDVEPVRDLVIEGVERGLIVRAFQSLPQRWQQVLWLTCVEGHSADTASQILQINPNALTSLAYRAREGLRQAYLQAYLPVDLKPRCAPFAAKLGGLLRDGLGPTLRTRVERHVAECPSCTKHLSELHEVNGTLREHLMDTMRVPAARSGDSTSHITTLASIRGEDRDWSTARVA